MSFKNKHNNNMFSVISQRDGSRTFKGEHDDRFYNAPNKNFQRGRGSRGRGRDQGRRGRGFKNFNQQSSRYRHNRYGDEDGDEHMGDGNRGRGAKQYRSFRGRGTRRASGGHLNVQRQLANPEKQWYKVLVPFGARVGKEALFKLIQENTDVDIPFENYHILGERALFNVLGVTIAESLKTLSRRISGPDGQKLVLVVSESGPPRNLNLSDEQKEKLKLRMSERYDPSLQLLDLSSIHSDESLRRCSAGISLTKDNVMEAVSKIISEHIPEMTGVNLSQNKIFQLSSMVKLVKAAPGVTSLNLGKNQIRSLDELDKLKGWSNIVELNLDGNSLCDAYNNKTEYISDVRKRFPKVVKLDGNDLPPPITFDLETVPLPASEGSYFLNDEVKNLLVTFVKEYYNLFDSENRKMLVAAYHKDAQFSTCAVRNSTLDRQGDIGAFIRETRNLKKIGHIDSNILSKKVKVGQLSVVAALEEFPQTIHDLTSFKVDVMVASPTMLSFVLHGVFKETASRADKPIIRSFSRTFITIPAGEGVSIINDMLTISNAGVDQAMNAFKEGAPTPSSSPASSSQVTPSPAPSSIANSIEQQKLIENFVAQSGMNAEFSLKCLQENSWDYQRAALNFQELNSQGKIPPEAFIK